MGLEAARRLLASTSRETRLRGVRRIASLDDLTAAQLLARVLEEDASVASDERVRLEAIRALAPFAARDPVRARLVHFVLDEGVSSVTAQQSTGLALLARQHAALALAAADDARTTELLLGMLLGGSSASDLAYDALAAHPPSNIEPLLTTRALASVRVVELLGVLGDMRALTKLRFAVDKGDIAVRAAAAVSLARLGDEFPIKASRSWLDQAGTTHPVREAAAQALVLMRATDAPRAIAILLADQATRATALRLAFLAPTPQLSPSLAGYLTIATPAERPATLLALARSGGAVAIKTLHKQMGSPKAPDSDAVFALAHCAHDDARGLLDQMLAEPASRRLAARASLLRLTVLRDAPPRLESTLRALVASSEPTDREIGAFGLALTRAESVATLIAASDVPSVRGACRASLALRSSDREACSAKLNDGVADSLRDALAQALGGDVAAAGVSSHVLLEWAERSDPMAIVFARALGSRDNETWRPRIRRLLASGDPILRGQMAFGLASSPSPSAVSLLTEAYWFETDALVRRAIVRSLSATNAAQKKLVLQTAARLDPDDQTRELARIALAGARLHQPVTGTRAAWISLASNTPDSKSMLGRAVIVVPATGYALGTVSDDDGFLLVPGLVPGEVRVGLAPSTATVQAPRP